MFVFKRKLFKNCNNYFYLTIPREVALSLVGANGGDVRIIAGDGILTVEPWNPQEDETISMCRDYATGKFYVP